MNFGQNCKDTHYYVEIIDHLRDLLPSYGCQKNSISFKTLKNEFQGLDKKLRFGFLITFEFLRRLSQKMKQLYFFYRLL